MMVHGMYVSDEAMLHLVCSAVEEGLVRAGKDPNDASAVEVELRAYYQFRDEVYQAIVDSYEGLVERVAHLKS